MRSRTVATGVVLGVVGVSTAAAAVAPAATAAVKKAKTYVGKAVETPWGPVQVQAVVKGKTIKAVTAVDFPKGEFVDDINTYAIPLLEKQAVTEQTRFVDAVSGASWTSYAFAKSLQSALWQAGLK